MKEKQDTKYTELENKFKKVLADYTNLEKDIEKRVELRTNQQKMQIIRSMLDVLDSLNLAITLKEKLKLDGDVKAWAEGVCATLSQIEKVLGQFGVQKVEVNSGDVFDSNYHEAVGMLSDGEKGKIHEVVQPGYVLGDYVIRPARVIVYQGKI